MWQNKVSLISAIPICLCLGTFYSWSVFSGPLSTELDVSLAVVMVAFTISSCISGPANILGGILYNYIGPKLSLIIGGVLFSSGIFFSGCVKTVGAMHILYGIIMGTGLGISYCTFSTNAAKLFPDKRGVSTGIVIGAYGLGSFLFSPIANNLIQEFGVFSTFRMWGMCSAIIILISACFVKSPVRCNENIVTEKIHSVEKKSTPKTVDKKWKDILKDPQYYKIVIIVIIVSTIGTMILSHAFDIIQSMSGLKSDKVAWTVGFISVSNACGRVFWGVLSDRAGRCRTLWCIFLLLALVLSCAVFFQLNNIGLVTIMLLVGFNYGGAMAMFPALTVDCFGENNSGINLGFVLIGTTFGSFIGPTVASVSLIYSGTYKSAFVIGGIMCLVGIILSNCLGKEKRSGARINNGQ